MPASFDDDFALWLTQHGNERSVAVNVLEFRHSAWNDDDDRGIFVSDYGEPFEATTEAPAFDFTADALGFTADLATDNVTTEQRVTIRLDNANGLVAQQLRELTPTDLQEPVVVIFRTYLDTKRTAPV